MPIFLSRKQNFTEQKSAITKTTSTQVTKKKNYTNRTQPSTTTAVGKVTDKKFLYTLKTEKT